MQHNFVPAFQASAASGSDDLKTQEAKAIQTKHMSDCLSLEKIPSCPVRGTKVDFIQLYVSIDFYLLIYFCIQSSR